MFLLCCTIKTKGKMQDFQDKDTSTDDVQKMYETKKNPAQDMDVCVVCCKGEMQDKDTTTDEL